MTLTELITNLTKLVEENPGYGSLTVITAADDEGNGFSEIHYTPSLGYFVDSTEFTSDQEDIEERGGKINAVCVN